MARLRAVTARSQIDEIADAYVICRTIGHAWDDNPAGEVDSDLWRVAKGVIALRCTRCYTERFDYINDSMAVFQRYYRYPDNWTKVEGEGKRPQFRGEMLRRSLLIRTYQAPRKRA